MQNLNAIISVSFIFILLIILLVEKYKKNEFKKIDIEKFLQNNRNKIIIIVIILALIFISRIYKFGTLPITIGVDEAGAAYDAYCLANFGVDRYLNSFPLYLINFGGGQSALYAYLNVVLIKILGNSTILISRLPALILFIMAIFISYKLVSKKQDKKTAVLLAFLITLCPWHIIQSRFGLDCNLLGPLFILDLLLLENAKKNYQYILAGISVGITLYTYSLSYLIMPVFLLIWVVYHLYTKTINIKQIMILASTVFIFALPLMYFILLNMGIVEKTNFGIFTIPKLFEFRVGEIALQNIVYAGIDSITKLFFSDNTLYYLEIPFFVIGIIKGIEAIIKSIKTKEYSFLALMTLTFFAILIPNLLVHIVTTNKGNILYIPILYFVAVGMIELIKDRKILWQILVVTYILLFTIFEIYYYTNFSVKSHSVYEDRGITNVIEYIDGTEKDRENIYLFTYQKSEPYIYILLNKKISPYEYDETKIVEKLEASGGYYQQTKKCSKYHFYDMEGIKEYHNDRTYIVNKKHESLSKFLEKIGYKKETVEEYYIFT